MKNKKTLVILISGRIGSGKTTLADMMIENFDGMGYSVRKFFFAESLKLIAKRVFGWNGEKDEKGRAFLQELGSTVRRFNIDYWADTTQAMIENNKNYPFDIIVIDDWRYPNEREVMQKSLMNEVYTIRLSCDNETVDSHESENSLPEFGSSYYFISKCIPFGKEHLKENADLFCESILEEYYKGE